MSGAKEELKNYFDSYKKSIIAILFVLSYLAVGLSLYYNVPAFTLHWLIFGLVAVIIPSGLTCMYDFSSKFVKPDCKQKENAVKVIIKHTLFYWLADCVYMAIFNGWTTWTYILGILFIILVLLNLARAFLSNNKRNAIINFFDAADLLLGLAATVYLIYIIPENLQSLQTIITTIVAAVYGGLLTLVGVAWTIKKADSDRKEEERKKYRPMAVFFKGSEKSDYEITLSEYDDTRFVSIQKSSENRYSRVIKDFKLRNLDLNAFFVEGLIFNNNSVLFRYANLYVEKEKIILFSFQDTMLYFVKPIQQIGVLVKDLLDNEYIIDLGFDNEVQSIEKNCIQVKGSKRLIEYTKD